MPDAEVTEGLTPNPSPSADGEGKTSHARFSASNLHLLFACERLRIAAQHAITNLPSHHLQPKYATPTRVAVTFVTADMAEAGAILRGVECDDTDPRTVICTGDNRLALFQAFVGRIMITRTLAD